MANLFASRLKGLEEHYASLMSTLESIEKRAKKITRSKDYNDLPGQGVSFDSESEDCLAICSDIFWLLGGTYDSYFEFARDYFDQAPRSDHDEILSEIVGIARDFDMLVEQSVTCEIDMLARLWFFQVWENSANSFDASIVEEDKKYFEVSNFKLLSHVAHHTGEMLSQYFGYLDS